MRPKLFRWSDLLLMFVPILIVGILVGAWIWNYTSPDGEDLAVGAWVTSIGAVVGCIAIATIYYVQRWFWVRKYAYTVRGVDYFYESGTSVYLAVDIERDIEVMLGKWFAYYESGGTDVDDLIAISRGNFISGSICLFKPERSWDHTAVGWWTRRVTGISGWDWAIVGQGDRLVEQTAHGHELAHIHVSHFNNRYVPETEAHELFKKVGV